MSKSYVIEKTLQIVIGEDDLVPGETLTEDLALEIAEGCDIYEWQPVNIEVAEVRG